MSYRVTINGTAYQLPPRTLAVDDKIEHIQEISKQYAAGEIKRRKAAKEIYDFVQGLIVPGTIGIDLDDVDTNELLVWCLSILNAYNEPVHQAKAEAMMTEVRPYLNNGEMDKMLKAANAMHTANGIGKLK